MKVAAVLAADCGSPAAATPALLPAVYVAGTAPTLSCGGSRHSLRTPAASSVGARAQGPRGHAEARAPRRSSGWPGLAGVAAFGLARVASHARPRSSASCRRAAEVDSLVQAEGEGAALVAEEDVDQELVLTEEEKAELAEAMDVYPLSTEEPVTFDEPADALIPQQPIGRLVTKGGETCLEYDPEDAPEFLADEYGTGKFTWEPLTPEGFEMRLSDYMEEAIPVPADRLHYLQGAGFLEAEEDEDFRAYIDDKVTVAHGRKWQKVVLKGHRDGVQAGTLRLMAGIMRRRPWDPPDTALPAGGAAGSQKLPSGITDVLMS